LPRRQFRYISRMLGAWLGYRVHLLVGLTVNQPRKLDAKSNLCQSEWRD
jgi:hypothetical protein